jgi:hypothetical protein
VVRRMCLHCWVGLCMLAAARSRASLQWLVIAALGFAIYGPQVCENKQGTFLHINSLVWPSG